MPTIQGDRRRRIGAVHILECVLHVNQGHNCAGVADVAPHPIPPTVNHSFGAPRHSNADLPPGDEQLAEARTRVEAQRFASDAAMCALYPDWTDLVSTSLAVAVPPLGRHHGDRPMGWQSRIPFDVGEVGAHADEHA